MASDITIGERNKDFFLEKLFSFGIALGIIFSLNPSGVADAYLILGHSHFMITAWYQYKRGCITPKKILIYFIALIALFKFGHTFPGVMTVFTAAFLIVHVFSGEVRHFNRLYTIPYVLLTFCVMTLLSSWLAMRVWDFEFNLIPLTIALNVLMAVSLWFYFSRIKLKEMDAFYPVFFCVYLIFSIMVYVGYHPSSFETFGFIVIAHYMTTYFNVTKKFHATRPAIARTFILESLFINGVFLLGFIAVHHWVGTNNLVYDVFYHPISFYVWTLMHFLTTWNNDEFRHVLKTAAPFVSKEKASARV